MGTLSHDDTISRAIDRLADNMRENSERWFPQIHDGSVDLVAFYTLGLSGEVGEVCNEIKKRVRESGNDDRRIELGEELSDVLTYLLLLAGELGVDLLKEYVAKEQINNRRWGSGVNV